MTVYDSSPMPYGTHDSHVTPENRDPQIPTNFLVGFLLLPPPPSSHHPTIFLCFVSNTRNTSSV